MSEVEENTEQLVTASEAARCRITALESALHPAVACQDRYDASPYVSLVRLYELEIASLQDLFDFALEEALVLTKSSIGYICFYNEETKVFTLYSWSKSVMPDCRVIDKPGSFCLENTGVWGEVVRQRKAVVINDFSKPNKLKRGCPDGHVTIKNFLSIPVWKENKIDAVIAVGNKKNDYTGFDIQQLDLFAKGVWVIARRKEAEDALRLNEERYRSVVEAQTEVISRFTPERTFLFVNEVYCRFFGKTSKELIGTQWTPVVVVEDIPLAQKFLDTLSVEHPVGTIEIRVYNAQNKIRWMQFVAHAIFDNHAKMIEVQSVGRDVTAQKEAEEALLEGKLRWEFALEGSGDGAWDWDVVNNTLFFSKRCKSMLGYEDHEIKNDPSEWHSRVHPSDLESCLDNLYRHLRGETPVYEKEHRLRCKNGTYTWALSRGKVLRRDARGKPLRVIGTITDITERKRIETLKEEVDKIMKHDLRSPLIGIVGLPDILLENKTLGAREKNILHAIQDAGYKILSMIDNSISIYKMEMGLYELNAIVQDVIPMLFKGIDSLDRQFKNKKILFLIMIDGRELSQCDRFMIKCEETFFCNMISNLLLNAAEASPAHETIYIILSTAMKFLSILNKGTVPIEIRDRFFEKYVTAGKEKGTGLGTYSAALIAKTHGWKIRLDTSIPGETAVIIAF